MSSRGAKTENGHVTTTEYKLKDGKMVENAKVLENLEIMIKQDFRLLKLATILSNL